MILIEPLLNLPFNPFVGPSSQKKTQVKPDSCDFHGVSTPISASFWELVPAILEGTLKKGTPDIKPILTSPCLAFPKSNETIAFH